MGSKVSTETTYKYRYSASRQESKHYNNFRVQNEFDHRQGLISNNVAHVTNQEIVNFQKQNNLTRSSSAHESNQSKKKHKHMLSARSKQTLNKDRPSSSSNTQSTRSQPDKNQSNDTSSDSPVVIKARELLYKEPKEKSSSRKKHTLEILQDPWRSESPSVISSASSTTQKTSSANGRKQIPPDLNLVLISPIDLQPEADSFRYSIDTVSPKLNDVTAQTDNVRVVGKGNFGTVYRAVYKNHQDVALKSLHCQDDGSPNTLKDYDAALSELLAEANIMTKLKHRNLLSIMGVTFFGEEEKLGLVMEFMKNGSLLEYLKIHRETFSKSEPRIVTMKLNRFARHIFEAMLYLEERNIIHRDLAARNCLIGQDDVLKVGDFGLTTLTECGLYKGTYRSICAPRWTSPEALFSSKYSSRSDVWSYGITLWEIYSLGERPFGKISNFAVHVILKNPSENLSQYLPQSETIGSNELYTHIMLPCLTYNVTMRPRFRDLKERLLTITS